MNRKTIIEVTPNPATAIITALNAFDVPWKNNNYYVPDDTDYILNFSATKIISRMTDILLNNDGELSANAFAILANVIYKMYSKKWNKLYDTFTAEYNPIENYNMTERMTNDETVHSFNHTLTRTDNLKKANTGDDTVTHNVTDTLTENLSHTKTGTETKVEDNDELRTDNLHSEKETKIQGLNSETYQPSNLETVDNTGTQSHTVDETDTITYNTVDADTGTETNAKTGTEKTDYNTEINETGTQTHVDSGNNTDTRNYLLNRSGNIGVTTTQDMIQSERELWEYNFRAIVYRDIDSIMTIEYYKGDCES